MKSAQLLLILSLSAVASANEVRTQISFTGALKQCVEFNAPEVITLTNARLAKTDVRLLKSIGDCGCTSAVAAYSVAKSGHDYPLLATGRVVLLESGPKVFFLTSDPAERENAKLVVDVHCASPD